MTTIEELLLKKSGTLTKNERQTLSQLASIKSVSDFLISRAKEVKRKTQNNFELSMNELTALTDLFESYLDTCVQYLEIKNLSSKELRHIERLDKEVLYLYDLSIYLNSSNYRKYEKVIEFLESAAEELCRVKFSKHHLRGFRSSSLSKKTLINPEDILWINGLNSRKRERNHESSFVIKFVLPAQRILLRKRNLWLYFASIYQYCYPNYTDERLGVLANRLQERAQLSSKVVVKNQKKKINSRK